MGNKMGKAKGFVLSRRDAEDDYAEDAPYKWVHHSNIKVPKNIREQFIRECRRLGKDASWGMVSEAVFVSKEGYIVTFGNPPPTSVFPFTALDSEGKTVFLTPFSCKAIQVGDLKLSTETRNPVFVQVTTNAQNRVADAESTEALESMGKMNALPFHERMVIFEREVKTLSKMANTVDKAYSEDAKVAAPHMVGLVDELVQLTHFLSVQQPDATSCDYGSWQRCLNAIRDLSKQVAACQFYKEAVKMTSSMRVKNSCERSSLLVTVKKGNVIGLVCSFARVQKLAGNWHHDIAFARLHNRLQQT